MFLSKQMCALRSQFLLRQIYLKYHDMSTSAIALTEFVTTTIIPEYTRIIQFSGVEIYHELITSQIVTCRKVGGSSSEPVLEMLLSIFQQTSLSISATSWFLLLATWIFIFSFIKRQDIPRWAPQHMGVYCDPIWNCLLSPHLCFLLLVARDVDDWKDSSFPVHSTLPITAKPALIIREIGLIISPSLIIKVYTYLVWL